MRPSLAAKYSGLDTSLKILTDKVDELKPDGLLGNIQFNVASAYDLLIPTLSALSYLPRYNRESALARVCLRTAS